MQGADAPTRDEIIEAAQRSYAHEFIEPLPKGYDTVIGENKPEGKPTRNLGIDE